MITTLEDIKPGEYPQQFQSALDFLESIAVAVDQINKLSGSNAYSSVRHKIDEIKGFCSTLYSRSKYKPEDRVVLNRTPEITKEKSWGWMGSKHFLIEGAKATVKDVEYRNDLSCFCYGLHFDIESYLDFRTKEEIPIKNKSLYYFREDSLNPL